MIIFLNFTPFEFFGGAEKWMYKTASDVNQREKSILMEVSPSIANFYGNLVLKRTYKKHVDADFSKISKKISLTIFSFVPLTKQWLEVRDYFKSTRLIYARFEILEIFICFYFGGPKIFSKTIAGIILTPVYQNELTFFQRLHNIIYQSNAYLNLLRLVKKVHVLNKKDLNYYKNIVGIKNTVYLPPSVPIPNKYQAIKKDLDKLEILYVGEISQRKGLDTIIEVIEESPSNFIFNIVGDGPMKKEISELTPDYKNCKYYGYVSDQKLHALFQKSDVILFPSRGESFGLAMVEAAGYGLQIVNSAEVSLNLPSYMETSIPVRDPKKYIQTLTKLWKDKINKKKTTQKIIEYIKQNFSEREINKQFQRKILEVN